MSRPNADSLAQRRYADLVAELGDEGTRCRGWQTRVADRLGVHRSYVSRIARGDTASVGLAVVERAVSRLGIPMAFFASESGSYRDFAFIPVGGAIPMPTDDAEFSVMRALIALDDQTRARVLAWAESRWPR